MHAPRRDFTRAVNPRNPAPISRPIAVAEAVCPLSASPVLVGEIVVGLLQGRDYRDPSDDRQLETVDAVIECLRVRGRVLDGPRGERRRNERRDRRG